MGQIYFREEFLHYVWKMKKFKLTRLATLKGESIQLIDFGFHNHNAGPDFLEARLKIGDTLWAGNVEIHIKSSDWDKHKHQNDPAYNNVILHVVYVHDKEVFTKSGNRIPCLELKDRISDKLLSQYLSLASKDLWIPCADQIHLFDVSRMSLFLQSLSVERIEEKAARINLRLSDEQLDWEQVFYETLVKYFGFKVNNFAFERLAELSPLSLVRKYARDVTKLEALLFGQSGLITGSEAYCLLLKREYGLLKVKHQLSGLSKDEWKFSRLRPANFPTIRLAQVIALLNKEANLFLHILENLDYPYLIDFFSVEPNVYWKNHYIFGIEGNAKKKKLGKQSIEMLLINVVVPVLFLYGKVKGDELVLKKTSMLLEKIKAESNLIITQWKTLGFKPMNASESQALIHLKMKYCDKFRCLECQIGNKLLSS